MGTDRGEGAAAPKRQHPARPLMAVGGVLAGVVLATGVGAVVADSTAVAAALAATGGGTVTSVDQGPAGGLLLTVAAPSGWAHVVEDGSRTVRSVRISPLNSA